MDSLFRQLTALLFVAGKPLTTKKIAALLSVEVASAAESLRALAAQFSPADSGMVLLHNNGEWQLATNPAEHALVEKMVKAELSGELTRPQLEALTVVAYCGPLTKPELETVRGVNCSLILRHLMLRGLVEEADSAGELLPRYCVSLEFLRHLGLTSVTELPDYAALHQHEYIVKALTDVKPENINHGL
ncbi:MAG: SMC-Scp complex subunit ScpB [Candidatus Magasanikbacteria bacterium]|nr:SMC-Scp complex subunit ScpB [Candidatus Magasanikbacteria bacterium]